MKRFFAPALLGLSTVLLAGCGGPNLIERMGGGWSVGLCGTVILILDVLVLIEIVGSNWTTGRKALWALLIIFFPVGGLIFYWFFAR